MFCLKGAEAANWDICKASRLLGISRQGVSAAAAVQEGDSVYVWRGGPRDSGLLASAKATGPAIRPTSVPWPNPENYSLVVPFSLHEELATPISDSFPSNRRGIRFGIQNTDLQKGFRPVSDESARLLAECFGPSELADTVEALPVATPGSGWSSDQAVIRDVEAAAVAAARAHLRREGWREIRDCQQDGCGYDFLYAHADGRRRLVEVKGTAGIKVRFMLTRREEQVLSSDARGRIYVVLDALGTPKVEVLDWAAVESHGVEAASWQVG